VVRSSHRDLHGYGTYSVMPIPYHMALVWFLGSLIEGHWAVSLLAQSSRNEFRRI
jgi:hypothetical protein